ncbi:MAG: hypothetical protein K2I30_00695 [Clostridia bacterium]|nr:hypothetical protein [Clostridia bacterium]
MFEFFSAGFNGGGEYSICGFEIYTDKHNAVNIILGVLGIIAMLWNLVYGGICDN